MGAQLTEGWWKTAWPGDTLPKSHAKMKKTIKATKAARRGTSALHYIGLLDEITEIIGDLEKEAATQFKSAPSDKRKAIAMLAEFRKFIARQKSGVSLDAKKVLVFKKSFGKALGDKVGDAGLAQCLGPMEVKLELMSWLVDELADKNADAMLYKAIDRAFETSVSTAARVYGKFTADGLMTRAQRETLTSLIEGIQKELAAVIVKIPAEVLRKIGISARMARDYKIDKGVSIGLGVVGTGLTGAGIGLPGTTPLAIAATVRSAAAVMAEIQGLRSNIEGKIDRFNTHLVALKTMFGKAGQGSGKMGVGESAGELTISMMNSLLGIDVLPTMKKANADLKDIEGKLALLAVKSQKFQKNVVEAIAHSDKMQKKLAENNDKDKRAKYETRADAAEAGLNEVLEETFVLAKRLTAAEDQVVELRRKLRQINDPKIGVKMARAGLDAMVQLVAAGGGLADTIRTPDPSQTKKIAGALTGVAGVYTELGATFKKLA